MNHLSKKTKQKFEKYFYKDIKIYLFLVKF